MNTRRIHRIVLLATFVAIAPVLAGCADFDTDKLDIFGLGEKKKLPGDRRPLFPEGVPGVTQGIPPEYVKGNQPPPETAQAAPVEPVATAPGAAPQKQTAAVAPAEKPKPKPKQAAKPKTTPKPKPASTATAPAQPATQQAPAPWPEPARQQPAQPATAPWPGQEQSSTTAPSTAPWPSAPPPGTFSR